MAARKLSSLMSICITRETRVTRIKSGPVNEQVDREFLRLVTEKDYAALRNWSAELYRGKLRKRRTGNSQLACAAWCTAKL